MKWYGSNGLKRKKSFSLVERMLAVRVKSLYRFCRRHKLNYAEIYLLDSDGSATINLRAKKDNVIVADAYAFVKARSKR